MGLLNDTTHQQYYQGNDYGNYQFTSLEDIINQFLVVYVGDDKLIKKSSRIDVAFHAQRGMQELSFDTFKSIKAQEIVVPPTLQMILPHDYVNYTKLSWSDSAGIKHPLYPTSGTSNPFSILQSDDGNYEFPSSVQLVTNADFDDPFVAPWQKSSVVKTSNCDSPKVTSLQDTISSTGGVLTFTHHVNNGFGQVISRAYAAWQAIDVTGITNLEISATGTSAVAAGGADTGVLRFGISSVDPLTKAVYHAGDSLTNANATTAQTGSTVTSPNILAPDLGHLEWIAGEQGTEKSLTEEDGTSIDVSAYDTVWLRINSFVEFSTCSNDPSINSIDEIFVGTNLNTSSALESANNTGNSRTWSNYRSGTPSENQDDYQDDTYWPMDGSRFGLDPQHAQANGSFYINQRLGKIHFSSNISGKTVILDYISDGLGTDAEMQVHKFAEEAMYKYIVHAILSGSSYGQQLVPRLTKEKFAAIRKAKLRLSNIKLEELTQILRGKSKQIKH